MQLAVYSGCAVSTLGKLDKIDPVEIGNVKIKSVMKIAATLECSPVDLLPFLGATVSPNQSVKYSRDGPRKRSVRAREMTEHQMNR
jgi:DNA-binding Xre family transcriptional regulator